MSSSDKPVCVIAFFGIDRRLDITAPSIIEHIIEPAKAHFDVKLKAHLWGIDSIENARSGESGRVEAPRFSLLPEGEYQVELPMEVAAQPEFQTLCEYGDFWQDGYKSLSNLYSQLVSLKKVTEIALVKNVDRVIFVRPDLLYHDSFVGVVKAMREVKEPTVWLPHWQPHGGCNDRFAVCYGREAIEAYGNRLEQALAYCQQSQSPLHAERLVKFALSQPPVKVKKIGIRASRVRIDGSIKVEDFSYYGWKPALRGWLGKWRQK